MSAGQSVLGLLQPESDDWSFTSTGHTEGAQIAKAISLPELFARLELDSVDLVNMDLQGFEYEVLQANLDFLQERIRTLTVFFSHASARKKEVTRVQEELEKRGFVTSMFHSYHVFVSTSP